MRKVTRGTCMKDKQLRVRFAPAPTGMMHLGNVRTALMNFLMAQQQEGTFILRIEDTDSDRNFDPGGTKIIEDLTWLGITYDEGPVKGGPCAPYLQSQRTELYKEKLQELIDSGNVYRCFCSSEELEKKRQRQIALKQPPRYDKHCLTLSDEESKIKAQKDPFIWRVKLDPSKTLMISDLSHGMVKFDLQHFSDFPITRQDGSVTFMFANFVDDVTMKITCVIRGEDHLSNTAGQAALYHMFGIECPRFWHMPILCTKEGKKLSKRDFGFSLRDLKDAGFIPEAINNYLAIIGGSFKNEIMSQEELLHALDFEAISSSTRIKYDVDKLRWVNHKWLCTMETKKVAQRCLPFLEKLYPSIKDMDKKEYENLIGHIQKELVTLRDAEQLLAFYFEAPRYEKDIARTVIEPEKFEELKDCVKALLSYSSEDEFLNKLKSKIEEKHIKTKSAFSFIRYAVTGRTQGIGVSELITILGLKEVQQRISTLVSLF